MNNHTEQEGMNFINTAGPAQQHQQSYEQQHYDHREDQIQYDADGSNVPTLDGNAMRQEPVQQSPHPITSTMHDTLPAEVQHQFNIDKQAFHELMKQVV